MWTACAIYIEKSLVITIPLLVRRYNSQQIAWSHTVSLSFPPPEFKIALNKDRISHVSFVIWFGKIEGIFMDTTGKNNQKTQPVDSTY